MGSKSEPVTSFGVALLCLLLVVTSLEPAAAYRDDWYGFVSFQDTSEWQNAYTYTCNYQIDLFREPRQFSERNRLKPRGELLTPIRFLSNDTKDAERTGTNINTLHVYNNPGIRRAHSVSYGFQRNKECLHGEDSECVVYPELGRIRVVVLNAERFAEKQNLNFVKDHFLIEKPERFTTIINGGSQYERKFYEAIFLGGYPNYPTRTSHQIDGKTYPLEIYMYFLDETVPSVSLSTILVVLVEESDRDNPYIKPITNAIEDKLYDAERKFLYQSKVLTRRERLYHHLKSSVAYDVHGRRYRHKDETDPIIYEPLHSSIGHEAEFSRYVEVFERMQALEAEIFFLLEDYHRVKEEYAVNRQFLLNVQGRIGNDLFPANNTELQMLSVLTLLRGYVRSRDPTKQKGSFKTCETAMESFIRKGRFWNDRKYKPFKNISQIPTGQHMDDFVELAKDVCHYFDGAFSDLHRLNINDTEMVKLSNTKKYELIHDLKNDRWARDQQNQFVYDHFQDKMHHDPNNSTLEKPDYKDPRQAFHLVDGIYEYLLKREKRRNYLRAKLNKENDLERIAKDLGYASLDELHKVTRYLKRGSKQNDLNYYRAKVHDEFVHRLLPGQEKKRSFVEFGGMEIDDRDILAYEDLDPVKATVNEAFQVSWLIPPDGGYYFYDGSSPVPPCFRAENVIVFKRPIKMSRRQIDILTRIPTSFDKSEDVQYTTPHIHDTFFEVELSGTDTFQSRLAEVKVDVFNEKRNHLFLGHDGVHKNSVDEWEKIKKKRRGGAPKIGMSEGGGVVMISLLMLLLFKNLMNLVIC